MITVTFWKGISYSVCYMHQTMRNKCMNTEDLWSVFCPTFSPNTTTFSVFKNFSHSEKTSLIKTIFGMAFLTFFEASMLFFTIFYAVIRFCFLVTSYLQASVVGKILYTALGGHFSVCWNWKNKCYYEVFLISTTSCKAYFDTRREARNFWGQGRFLQIRAQIFGSSESQS